MCQNRTCSIGNIKRSSHSTNADYLAKNKVVIVDSVLETFRNKDGKLLQNFEFYCEGKSYVMEV